MKRLSDTDAESAAWVLYMTLVSRFGKENVFFDKLMLQRGVRWLEEAMLHRTVPAALIALIGPQWMSALRRGKAPRRGLQDRRD